MADRILDMEFAEGYRFVFFAKEQIQEERLFQRWINGYQQEMTFGDFKEELKKTAKEQSQMPKSDEEAQEMAVEILEKVKGILRKDA